MSRKTTSDPGTAREAVQQALDDALRDAVELLTEVPTQRHERPFAHILERMEYTAVAAASGNPHAAVGAFRQLANMFSCLSSDIATALDTVTHERDRHAQAISQHLVTIERLESQLRVREQETTTQLAELRMHMDADRRSLEERLAAAERTANASPNDIVRRATAYVAGLPELLAQHIAGITSCTARLEQLNEDYLRRFDALEEVIVPTQDASGATRDVARRLTEEVRELRSDVAPLRAALHALSAEDRQRLVTISERYHRVDAQYWELLGLIEVLRKETESINQERHMSVEEGRAVNQRITAALALLPAIFPEGSDIFAIVRSSTSAVENHRQQFAAARTACDTAIGHIRTKLNELETTYAGMRSALEPTNEVVGSLREYIEISWYEGYAPAPQRLVRAAVFALAEHARPCSTTTLIDVLSRIGCFTGIADPNTACAALLHADFFAPGGGPEAMRLLRLTDAARYWEQRWRREEPALAEQVKGAWASRTVELQRAKEAEAAARAARAAKRREIAEREAEQRNVREAAEAHRIALLDDPVVIAAALPALEQRILQCIAAALPAFAPNAGLDMCIRAVGSAATTRDALPAPRTRPATIADAAHQVVYVADPPLVHLESSPQGTHVALTPIGLQVLARLKPFPATTAEAIARLVGTPFRHWQARDRETAETIAARVNALRHP